MWPLFDRIIERAKADAEYNSPWSVEDDKPVYKVDEKVLSQLLGVPLMLGFESESGRLAKPLDAWAAHELRRAGFDPDTIWPRDTPPRFLAAPVAKLLDSNALTVPLKEKLRERLLKEAGIAGVSGANANILGKLYDKQVDAGMSRWQTGPEVLISGKRMDSSFGSNTKNRVEESYGDAKNLRLRYPLAALGFVFALRSTIVDEAQRSFAQVVNSLTKLGEEDDAYHATCLLMIEYEDSDVIREVPDPSDLSALDASIEDLPSVALRWDVMPEHLAPNEFIAKIVNRVLDVTPNDHHVEARKRRGLTIAGVPEA
jgi:hypothetical protein